MTPSRITKRCEQSSLSQGQRTEFPFDYFFLLFFSNFLLSLLRDCARTEDWSERPMTCGNCALGLVHTRQEWNRHGKIRSSIGFNFVRECVLGEFTMGSSDTIRWKRYDARHIAGTFCVLWFTKVLYLDN